MAARRAAAKAAAAKAEAPPPPAPEPTPEPQPEPKEPENPAEKKSSESKDDEKKDVKPEDIPKEKVTERIIERIIICPGGQDPYMQAPLMPPSQGHCYCVQPCSSKGKHGKRTKKKGKAKNTIGEDGPCKHPFCVAQREQTKPQGLPWASGMYNYQNAPAAGSPNVTICQTPVLSCCPKCNPPDSDSSESEEDDPVKKNTETYMTFMNMVFAAANVMNERPGML